MIKHPFQPQPLIRLQRQHKPLPIHFRRVCSNLVPYKRCQPGLHHIVLQHTQLLEHRLELRVFECTLIAICAGTMSQAHSLLQTAEAASCKLRRT